MEKVFAYLRVSDSSQIKKPVRKKGVHKKYVERDGFLRQEKAVRDYCKAHDLNLVQIFKEDFTGTEYDRPVKEQLMLTLEQNTHGIKTVIIESLDRLARNLMVQEIIVAEFQIKGFNLISVMEGANLLDDDYSRVAIRQMMGVFAQYKKAELVWRLRASRERIRAKTGRCEGRKSYKEIDEFKDLFHRMQDLRRKPKYGKPRTYQQIADVLNAEGTLTMDGKKWTLWRVQQTLTQKRYPRKKKQ